MKGVVLAAGEGVRLRPLTATRPKALLPLAGKPILIHILETMKKVGVNDILIVISYLGEQIKATVGKGTPLDLRVSYVKQEKTAWGTGVALLPARNFVDDDSFLVIYGDLYLQTTGLKAVVNTWKKKGGNLMLVVEAQDASSYGHVRLNADNAILNIEEKPVRTTSEKCLVNAGVYVFTQDVFKALDAIKPSSRGEYELTDALNGLVKAQVPLHAVQASNEEWMDIGQPWHLLEANRRILENMKPIQQGQLDGDVRVEGKVTIGRGTRIRGGCTLEGPVYIGDNCDIGPNAYIRPYCSFERNVKFGNYCEAKNTIILENTHIPHLSYLGDSIIGAECNLGAGTVVGNLRFDDRNVKMMVGGRLMDTGRRKLGVILGDRVKTGVNVSLMPGVKAGPNSWIGPGLTIYSDVAADTQIVGRLRMKEKKLRH